MLTTLCMMCTGIIKGGSRGSCLIKKDAGSVLRENGVHSCVQFIPLAKHTHTQTHRRQTRAGQGKVPAPEQMLRAVCERRVTPALLRRSTFSLVHGPHVQCPAEQQLPAPSPSWPRGGLAVFQASHLRLLRHLGSSHRPETRSHFSLTHIICMREGPSFI